MNGPANLAPQPHAEPPEQAAPRHIIKDTIPPGKGPTADAPQPPAPAARLAGWPSRLAWLPIPLLLAAMGLLWVADLRGAYESASLLLVLNLVCSMLAPCFIAYLVARSFLVRAIPGLLLLGCGVIAWGAAGMVGVTTGILAAPGGELDINLLITIHNLCVWLSAVCHLAGAVFLSLRPRREMRPARLWLTVAYTLALGAVALVTVSALARRFPLFFVQGQGGTPVRLFVLGSATAMFVLSAALLGAINRRESSRFVYWYTPALVLIAVGLFGIMIELVHASPLSWTGRAAQFLGGAYMLIAAIALGSERGAGGLTRAPGLSQARYRYGVAIVIVAASAALRLALFQSLGTRAAFVTFYPAVMLAALYGGFRCGLLATVLSAAVANYFWMEPVGHFFIQNPADGLSLAIFLLSCLMVSWITDGTRRAQVRTTQAEAEAKVAAERVRAAEELRQSEQRYRSLFDNMLDGYAYCRMIHDNGEPSDFVYLGVNAAFERLTGLKDVVGKKVSEAIPGIRESGRELIRTYGQVACTGQPERFETYLETMGIWFLVSVYSPAKDHFVAVFDNITDRKRAEESVRASEALLRAVTDHTTDAVYVKDDQSRWVMANPALLKIVGKPLAEVLGRTDAEIYPDPAVGKAILENDRRVMEGGEPQEFEEAAHTPQGTRIFLSIKAPRRDEQGQVVGLVGISRDITDRKRAEEALQAALDRFYSALSNMTFAALLLDENDRIEFANQAFCDMFNLRESPVDLKRLSSREMLEMIRPAYLDPEADLAHIREIVARRVLVQDEEVPMQGGRTFLRDFIPIRFGESKRGRLWIHKDITDRKQAEEALQETKRTAEHDRVVLESIIQQMPVGIIVTDASGAVAKNNVAMNKIWRREMLPAENVDSHGYVAYHLDGREYQLEEWPLTRALRHGEKILGEEMVILRGDGTKGVVHVSSSSIKDKSGQVIAGVVIDVDITELKHAEEALRESEERYKAIIETQSEFVARYKAGGIITLVNDSLCQFFNCKPEDFIGRSFLQYIHEDERERVASGVASLNKEHPTYIAEARVILPDGRVTIQNWTHRALFDANGNLLEYQCNGRDITERKRAEEAVRRSEEQLHALADSILNLAWWANGDGYITWYNRRWYEYTGTTPQQMEGWGWQSVHDPQALPEVMERWRASIATGRPFEMTFPLRGADGRFRSFLTRIQPLKDAQGRVVQWFGTNTDVEELKRSEESLRQSQERLKLSLLEKEVLIKEIHHRVKNNLQVISSLVDLQAEALKEPTLRGVFAEMRDRVRSMALVHEKLYQSESLASVEFAEYTRSLLNYLARAHSNSETSIRLKLDLQPVSLPVETAVPCGLILNELVTNAFKHAFRGRAQGEIATALRTGPEGRVCLRVRDDGVGLQAGTDWRQSRSLGLQLVHLLAGQLNAIVEVRTGGGTEFLITFEQSQAEQSGESTND